VSEQRMAGKALACPKATKDVHENTKNRDWTIKEFGYGPINPDAPDEKFWGEKADLWDTDIETAKTARCGNCAAFDQTARVMLCIQNGINVQGPTDPERITSAANLGYCQLFHFKCAGARTCDAWVHGGPITDKPQRRDASGETNEMREIIGQLHDASNKHKKQAVRLTSLMEGMRQ
tara:strand:+ start:200 stop:730 length:531 start_codon:yes stop_codon:yes gene_type:complete